MRTDQRPTGQVLVGADREERLIKRLPQHRRIATRGKRQIANDAAMISIAAIQLWL